MIAFEKLYKTYAVSSSDIVSQTQALAIGASEFELDVPRNCVRVRKLIVTPTRLMLMPPEVMVLKFSYFCKMNFLKHQF